MQKIKIIIIDDHQMIRETLSYILNLEEDIEVIAEVGDPEESLPVIFEKHPDVVILDINMPQLSGFELVPLIRRQSPGTKIIAFSMYNQISYVKKMFRLGASGYVTKNSSVTEMVNAIRQVVQGKIYTCVEMKILISRQKQEEGVDNETQHLAGLSFREIEIIKYIKEGKSSKKIAEVLNISSRTVDAHRYHIFKKLNIHNTASMIKFVSQADISFNTEVA